MSDKEASSIEVTPELLARYDQPGPRYTSYPTAVEFHDGVTAGDYEACLARADGNADDPLSIYVHLPFCEHRCLYCGCHVIISPHKERALPYVKMLEKEIDMLAERLPHRRGFTQLHLGGGTPTYYPPQELGRLLQYLLDRFHPLPGAELAIEVDPRVTTFEHIDVLASLGFNRVSMGVQDFTPRVQEAVERIQSQEETAALIRKAREKGFGGVNIDLIYGLPYQQLETFGESVDAVIGIKPDRVAVYSFAFVPWMRAHMKKLDLENLPDQDTKYALFSLARKKFLAAGYEAIGMDHFALPQDELVRARREGRLRRNFQGYTVVPAPDVIGLGISAIGDVGGYYVQNVKKLSTYEDAVRDGRLPVERGVKREKDDEIRRHVIHELMCNFVVDEAEVEKRFGIEFREYFREDLRRLGRYADEGMVTVTPEEIRVLPLGEVFIRNIAMCFDRYWREKHETSEEQKFSRTI